MGFPKARLGAACVPLLRRALPRLLSGELEMKQQDEASATYCRKLQKEDGVLDFSAPARVLAARINGLFPWPACAVEINGVSVKLGLADAVDTPGESGAPGEVQGADADGLLVGTSLGLLRVRKLQRPGGKMLPASEFLRGFALAPGTRIASQPMPPLVTAR